MVPAENSVRPVIRRATIGDIKAITAIYNDAILNTVATFDTQPKNIEEQLAWFKNRRSRHPVIVAEIGPEIAGWSSLSEWSGRCAYAETAELSVYVGPGHQGKGIGTQLVREALDEAARHDLHSVIGRIESSNSAVIHILEKLGFHRVGVLKEVGKKFNRRLDVLIMQLVISEGNVFSKK